jgi:hypothetical protein
MLPYFPRIELAYVPVFLLHKAVKRNIKRFPEDFMFRLTNDVFRNLIFQNGTSRGTPPITPQYNKHKSSQSSAGRV